MAELHKPDGAADHIYSRFFIQQILHRVLQQELHLLQQMLRLLQI